MGQWETGTRYLLAFSGGKDSTATVLLAHLYNEPLTDIYMAECMFRKPSDEYPDGISLENPEHMRFVREVAFPLFESWGYRTHILHSDLDYMDVFFHEIRRPRIHPDHEGMYRGFVYGGCCAVRRDCKLRPVLKFQKELRKEGPVVEYLGIAADEPLRLESLHKDPSRISLLEKYGYTEEAARDLAFRSGLLSPCYRFSKRQGCWACPHVKDAEILAILKDPDMKKAWDELVSLEKVGNKVYNRWNTHGKETLAERTQRLEKLLAG